MRKITLAGLVAVAAVLLIAPAAYAAPSMTVSDVVVPTGPVGEYQLPTTWNVRLANISAWDTSDCQSTAHFIGGDDWPADDVSADDDWRFWSYSTDTPYESDWDTSDQMWLPLDRVTATCKLEKTTYLGRRPYRAPVFRSKSGSSAFSRHGCPIYSYSVGKLTIDCRGSSHTGSASWRFPMRRSDYVSSTWSHFDLSQSTIGRHDLHYTRSGRSLILTETVSPGTMITINSVDATVSRRYWRKVFRHQSKTLRASWYAQ